MTETNTTTAKGIMPKLSIMMFIQFWIWGAWYLTVPNYIGTIPYMGYEAYYAYTAGPIAAMIAPFFLGLVADRFFNTEKILALLFLLTGVTMLCFPIIGALEGTVVQTTIDDKVVDALEVQWLGMTFLKHKLFSYMTLAHMLCYMPTLALTASMAFQHLKNSSKEFPLVRLWGTFGWIFAGLALPFFYNEYAMVKGADGELIKSVVVKAGETIGQFHIGGYAALLLGFLSLTLPKTPAPKKGEKVNVRDLFFMDVWSEFKHKSFLVFVLCSFLVCIPLQAYYAYLQTQMTTQGFNDISVWKNVGTWIEAGMMFAMPFFFRKLGVKKMIAIGIGAWVLRYALFSLAAGYGLIPTDAGTNINGFHIPYTHMGFLLIVAGVALHGLCYDFFFVTGQIYVDQVTDPKIKGQAQAMIVFFTQGLGMYIGAKLNELVLFKKVFDGSYANAGDPEKIAQWSSFWIPLCITAGVILLIFIFFFKHKDKPDAEFTHGVEVEPTSEGM